jgi:hypothetical protein
VPKLKTPRKPKPLYRQKPPKKSNGDFNLEWLKHYQKVLKSVKIKMSNVPALA